MGRVRYRQGGFTLIEVMVVVVIIAAFVGLAVLGLSQASDRPLRARAGDFESWLQALADRAVLDGLPYGLVASDRGVEARVWYRQHWFPVASPEPFALDGRWRVSLVPAEGEEPVVDEDIPPLVLGSSGSMGAIILEVPDASLRFDYRVAPDTGHFTLQAGGA